MSGSGHLATLATDLTRQGDRPALSRLSEERRRARAGVAHGAVPTRPPSVPGTSRSGASTPSPLSAPWPTPPPTGGAKALPSVPQLKRRDVAVGPVTRNTRRTKRVELPTLWRGPGPGLSLNRWGGPVRGRLPARWVTRTYQALAPRSRRGPRSAAHRSTVIVPEALKGPPARECLALALVFGPIGRTRAPRAPGGRRRRGHRRRCSRRGPWRGARRSRLPGPRAPSLWPFLPPLPRPVLLRRGASPRHAPCGARAAVPLRRRRARRGGPRRESHLACVPPRQGSTHRTSGNNRPREALRARLPVPRRRLPAICRPT